MPARTVRGATIVVAALLLVSCTKTLDIDKLKASIKSTVEKNTSSKVTSVDCPSTVKQEQGGDFQCTITLSDGSKHHVKVVQKDSKGNVRWDVVD
jgi:hypothetical protein